MKRPDNVDIWDGVELKRDETLTEEQKKKKMAELMKEVKRSAEKVKKAQSA